MRWWKTYSVLYDMNQHLRWSAEEISRYRLWKLRLLVETAYFKSPFYREFFDEHGCHPEQVQSEADLKRFPILEKMHIQSGDPLDFVTLPAARDPENKQDWVIESTSGSTGKPLKVYRTWRDLYYIKAKIIRAFQQTGFRYYQRQAVIKSSSESLTGKHWFEKLGILRKYWLSVTDPPGYNLRRLQEIKPQHMHAYPSGLQGIAELLLESNRIFHIPVICTGAEVLDPTIRREIEEAFAAEVFDLYGVREVGNIAWECAAHKGLHINDDALIVEILREDGSETEAGEEGEIVVTYLDGHEFPFIRYRLGDRAVRMGGTCSCGVPFSRLQGIVGRSDARILLPSGEWISGMVFQELRTAPWVSAFRIIQEEAGSIKLQVVPKGTLNPAELEALTSRTRELTNHQLEVHPEVLNRLEYDKSGKQRAVICQLDQTDNKSGPSVAEEAD